jgi:uncharacterized protein YndB with AHSA1/START domain
MNKPELRYEFYMGGTPEQVWEILISPEKVKQIYYGSVIESTFEIGSPIQYVGPGAEGDKTVHVYGTMLEYKPNKILSFTHFTGKSYLTDEKEYESRITFTLESVGESTKLILVHDQWSEKDPSYENSNTSWSIILSNSKTLLETGKTLNLGF